MTDHVRVWSDELARDPSSLAFLPLAETLRRRGQLDLARKVALRGIERHAHNPDAHDQLARIHADAGDLQAAFDEWTEVLRLVPGHVGAMKGMAFVRFQQGALAEAERLLLEAREQERGGDDGDISAAIRAVWSSGSMPAVSVPAMDATVDSTQLFADILAPDHSGIFLSGAQRIAAVLGCDPRTTKGWERPGVGSTVPGFRIMTAEPPRLLVIAGRHRFSRYGIVWRIEPTVAGSRVRAETRATFPGPHGALYRLAVIGTGGHVIVTRRLLAQVVRRAER